MGPFAAARAEVRLDLLGRRSCCSARSLHPAGGVSGLRAAGHLRVGVAFAGANSTDAIPSSPVVEIILVHACQPSRAESTEARAVLGSVWAQQSAVLITETQVSGVGAWNGPCRDDSGTSLYFSRNVGSSFLFLL